MYATLSSLQWWNTTKEIGNWEASCNHLQPAADKGVPEKAIFSTSMAQRRFPLGLPSPKPNSFRPTQDRLEPSHSSTGWPGGGSGG